MQALLLPSQCLIAVVSWTPAGCACAAHTTVDVSICAMAHPAIYTSHRPIAAIAVPLTLFPLHAGRPHGPQG